MGWPGAFSAFGYFRLGRLPHGGRLGVADTSSAGFVPVGAAGRVFCFRPFPASTIATGGCVGGAGHGRSTPGRGQGRVLAHPGFALSTTRHRGFVVALVEWSPWSEGWWVWVQVAVGRVGHLRHLATGGVGAYLAPAFGLVKRFPRGVGGESARHPPTPRGRRRRQQAWRRGWSGVPRRVERLPNCYALTFVAVGRKLGGHVRPDGVLP